MAQQHWLDILCKTTFRRATRRAVSRSLAAPVPGLLLDTEEGGPDMSQEFLALIAFAVTFVWLLLADNPLER